MEPKLSKNEQDLLIEKRKLNKNKKIMEKQNIETKDKMISKTNFTLPGLPRLS
jgi:hypothetical protein